ncbi:MAG: Bug family tripartite tricarboxylate transporter substrate binding protein [Betaproteobacteria bacterium]
MGTLQRIFALALGCGIAAGTALAQPYPSKPIRMVVPYPAGGGSDLMARSVSRKLSEKLKQNIVVDNRAGATGMIGTDIAAKSPADGYTLLLGSVAEVALNVAVYRKMPYNPERDLAPVALLATSPLVLAVHPSLPARSVKDFIALAKKRPHEIGYATAGEGSPHNVAGEWMKLLARIDILHVPYKGGGPQLVDLMGGHVHSGFLALPIVAPYLKNGRLHALAVTSPKRSNAIPEVPTLDESGLRGFDVSQWWGIVAPAGTSSEILMKLSNEIAGIVTLPDMKALMAGVGADPVASSPDHFRDYIKTEIAKFKKIVSEAKIAIQ